MHAVEMRTSYTWYKTPSMFVLLQKIWFLVGTDCRKKKKKIACGELILPRVYGEKLRGEFILWRESGKNLEVSRRPWRIDWSP